MNKEKMRIVINNLNILPESKFDFGDVVTMFNMANKCGSICCVVGWFPEWFPEEVKWHNNSSGGIGLQLIEAGKNEEFYTVSSEVLDMSVEMCCHLFSPLCQKYVHKDLAILIHSATPLQVAEMLEHFVWLVDEGEIDA